MAWFIQDILERLGEEASVEKNKQEWRGINVRAEAGEIRTTILSCSLGGGGWSYVHRQD